MTPMVGVRATGVLRDFAEAGVLAVADVHVAQRLGRLGGETDPDVLLAAALAVRGVRTGSVCVDLATVADTVVGQSEDGAELPVELPWPASWDALQRSQIVALGGETPWRPLRLVEGLLYLDRYWLQEQLVRTELAERAARAAPAVDLAPLRRLFPDAAPDRQRLAVGIAAGRFVSVVTGGPGTGKTHTVARLLRLLLDQPGPTPRIALAAPTGKAAARLEESVREQAAAIGLPLDLGASTLHRLLGWRPDSRSRFAHGPGNHLPYDVVVVDESSMVSLTMMARLLEAVRPSARLVLVGDPDQLTPVDAGAVLADLVHRPALVELAPLPAEIVGDAVGLDAEELSQLANGVVRLRESHRYGEGIGALAEAVRLGDADAALALLAERPELTLTADVEELRAEVERVAAELADAARIGHADEAVRLLGRHRLLCGHRLGTYGVASWNAQIARWIATPPGQWPPGTPLLVTANDYENELYNGDTGCVLAGPPGTGPLAAFARGGEAVQLPLSRLSAVQVAHALTVHRGQGSQYDAVSVLLPPPTSAILTRELLYTAVTRARDRVRIIGDEASVRAAIGRQSVRASGLRREL